MKSPFMQLCIAIVVGIATISGYAFWYSAVSKKSAEVASLANQITAATNNILHTASARAALAEIAGDEVKIQNYFVPESDVVGFITALQDLGTNQKTSVEVVSVSTISAAARPSLQLTLLVKGTFDAVLRTVGAIEYAPYDISISALSMVQSGKNAWQASMVIIVGSVADSTATSTKS